MKTSSCKLPVILVGFLMKLEFSRQIFSKIVLSAILRMHLKIQNLPRRKHRPRDKERPVNASYVSDSKYTVWLKCGILVC